MSALKNKMKVLAINGSPRGKDGCTEKMLQFLLEGMQKAGAKTEVLYLADKKIHHCIGCFNCWLKTPGICVFQDDMSLLLERVISADMLIFGTPLYYFNMTGLLKNFMDRTLPLASPFMEENKKGVTTHPSRYPGPAKKILLVSPCGFPEIKHFDALIATFKQICLAGDNEYIGEIVRPAAGLMLIEKSRDKIVPYFESLKQAGTQLIERNSINPETRHVLNETWISPEEFREQFNKYFKSELDKLSE